MPTLQRSSLSSIVASCVSELIVTKLVRYNVYMATTFSPKSSAARLRRYSAFLLFALVAHLLLMVSPLHPRLVRQPWLTSTVIPHKRHTVAGV